MEGDAVALVEDGDAVAASPMADLERAIPFANPDLYTTGTRTLADADLPEVLTRLSDTRFSLRDYPLAHKETLLLIAVSRQIELRAYRAGSGTLRSSFQRLSRIEDERGTRRVYEALGGTDRGTRLRRTRPDRDGIPMTVHEGTAPDTATRVRRLPSRRRRRGTAALVALESSPRVSEEFWTYRPDPVADIDRTIRESL